MTAGTRIGDLGEVQAVTGTDAVVVETGSGTRRASVGTLHAGLAGTAHTHAQTDITGLGAALAGKAGLDSPGFTGTPTAPTPTPATNSAQIANTAWVVARIAQAVADLLDTAPGALDTLNELAAALDDDPHFAATITAALAGKAALDHSHAAGAVTGLAPVALSGAFGDLSGTPPLGRANAIINGGCQSSRRSTTALSETWAYGPVDLFAGRLTDGSAGTLVRQPTTSLTPTGWFLLAQGVSAGPGGVLAIRHRIEAMDAARLADGPAVVSCRAWHNLGAARTATVTLRAADATDDFSATTTLTSASLEVPNNQEVDLVFPVSVGACGTGLEVAFTVACPNASGAWIGLGAFQISPGSTPQPFHASPAAEEARLVDRFLQVIRTGWAKANSSSNVQLMLAHPGLRVPPTYSLTGPLAVTDCVTADWSQGSPQLGTLHDHAADGGRMVWKRIEAAVDKLQNEQAGAGGRHRAGPQPAKRAKVALAYQDLNWTPRAASTMSRAVLLAPARNLQP